MKGTAGIAWFREMDYQRLLKIFEDANDFPKSYDHWMEHAEEIEHRLRVRGVRAVRIIVAPVEFARWCKLKKLGLDAGARRRYVRHGARRIAWTTSH